MNSMNDKPLPAMVLAHEAVKIFRGGINRKTLLKWEECGVIKTFRPSVNCQRRYYTNQLLEIANGGQTS